MYQQKQLLTKQHARLNKNINIPQQKHLHKQQHLSTKTKSYLNKTNILQQKHLHT